jgi:hypothetical protein
MDNDDLLFNLLYFQSQDAGETLGSLLNNVQSETVALHSENNTPYKLKPASEKSIAKLAIEEFTENDVDLETECAICKDDMDYGDDITRLPACRHYFHHNCLIRWINLQGWCPVCRAEIDISKQVEEALTSDDHDHCQDHDRSAEHYVDDAKHSTVGDGACFDFKGHIRDRESKEGHIRDRESNDSSGKLVYNDANTESSSPVSRSLLNETYVDDGHTSQRDRDWDDGRMDKDVDLKPQREPLQGPEFDSLTRTELGGESKEGVEPNSSPSPSFA